MQAFQQLLQQFPVRTRAAARQADADGIANVRRRVQQSDSIDENPPHAHAGRSLQQQAVGGAQLRLEYLRAGEDNFELILALQLFQVPAKQCRVANHLVRVGFEYHDDAGLVEFSDSLVYELQAHQGFAGPGCPLHQDGICLRDAALENAVQSFDPGLCHAAFRHVLLLSPYCRLSFESARK
jgi:hypothetical protein